MSSEISQAQSVSRKLLLARLAWAIIVLLCFVVVVVSEYVSLQNGSQEWLVITSYQALAHLLSFKAYLAYLLLVRHLILFLFIAVALLVLWRRTEDWMALLVSITLVLLPVTFFFSNISQNSLVPAPWDVIFSNLEALLTMTAIGCLLVLFSSFPDGVFKPAWLFPFMSAAFVLILIFFRLSASNENYWLAAVLTFALMLLVGVIGQIYRYRKNTSVIYRQQMKWVLLAFFFMAVTFPNIILFSLIIKDESLLNLISLHVQFLVYPLIPLSFAVAILRYRLWDIDVIIRRTLVYAVLTFSLALVYFVMVILLERVLRALVGSSGQVATVISTLAIAALFTPLRRRVQEIIDRRFYRRKYNAEQALAGFAAAARDQSDLDALTAQVVGIVQDTMQPEAVSLWLREQGEQPRGSDHLSSPVSGSRQ